MSNAVRVYLPATLNTVRSSRLAGRLLAGGYGHAVTAPARARFANADEEELAYEAYRAAARESLSLLRNDLAAPRRRVVVAADLPVTEPLYPPAEGTLRADTAVAVAVPAPLSAVVAIHVDSVNAEPDVAAAVAALGAAAAQDAVDAAEEHELEWFDVSEIDQLLGD
jgi:hypothetical protein